jgi:predicted membrane chloride channel (bestrophin family)
MLLYSNNGYIRLALQVSGSVLWQKSTMIIVSSLAAFNVAVTALMEYGPEAWSPNIPNNYAVATLGMVVAFASVFRTNLAWQRYWESLSQVHYMYSKCEDAYCAFAAFARTTVEQARQKGDEEKAGRVELETTRMRNYFGWMSAFACDRITHGHTNRMDRRQEIANWKEQVLTARELRHSDLTGGTKLPHLHEGVAADQNLNPAWENSFVVSSLPSDEELAVLDRSEDRVQVIVTWIIGSLSHLATELDTPPPIQSRIYQEISNAMVGFENCSKIADVPFPFPYAQLLSLLVCGFFLITPVAVACFTRSFYAGPIFTVLVASAICTVNEVAERLENPFGLDVNDICLEDLHSSFISVLDETAAVLDCQHTVRSTSQKARRQRSAMKVAGENEPKLGNAGEKGPKLRSEGSPARSPMAPSSPSPTVLGEGAFLPTRLVQPINLGVKVAAAPPPAPYAPQSCGAAPWPPAAGPAPIGLITSPLSKQASAASTSGFETNGHWRGSSPRGVRTCDQGREHGISGGLPQAIYVVDRHVAEIGSRTEAQLARIGRDLAVVPSQCPGEGKYRPFGHGGPHADLHSVVDEGPLLAV